MSGRAAIAQTTVAAPLPITRAGPSSGLQRQCACGGSAGLTGVCQDCQKKKLLGKPLQTKLRINEPGDQYEQEADRVAEQVMRIPDTDLNGPHRPSRNPSVQRWATSGTTGVMEAPPIVHDVLNSPGQPLDAPTRAFFEPRFGHDFSQVQVHADERAAESARAVNAQAYTVGHHVVFGTGQCSGYLSGGRLLAHELTHVVQQSSVAGPRTETLRRKSDMYYEALSGVDKGLTNKTLVPSPLIGYAVAAECGNKRGCVVLFEFPKAYTGDYPYALAGNKMLRGVYVKIAADWAGTCGPCSNLLLIQTVRHVKKGTKGIEADERGGQEQQQRSGWTTPKAASRGWRIDTPSQQDPYYTSPRLDIGSQGTSKQPAVLWDSPGEDVTLVDIGKEFQTCAVCDDGAGGRRVLACVSWGYFIDSNGVVKFQPETPSAVCGPTKELGDAVARWDKMPGKQPAGI